MPGAVTGADPAAGKGVVGSVGGTDCTAGRRASFAADPFDQVIGSTAADGDRTWRPYVTTGWGVVAVLAGAADIGGGVDGSGGATSARDHPGGAGGGDAGGDGVNDPCPDRGACADGRGRDAGGGLNVGGGANDGDADDDVNGDDGADRGGAAA